MGTLRKSKFKWSNFRVQNGKLLRWLKTGEQTEEEVIELKGQRFEIQHGVFGKFVGFGIEEPDALPVPLLELVLEDGNEKFVISTFFQGSGYSLNMIQRLTTIMNAGRIGEAFEFWPYEMDNVSEKDGKTYTNRGFTVKDSEGNKIEGFKFENCPAAVRIKEKTKTKPAAWDDEERMKFLEARVEEIKKAILDQVSQVDVEAVEELPGEDPEFEERMSDFENGNPDLKLPPEKEAF